MTTSPLAALRPGPARWAGAAVAALAVLGLGLVGGIGAARTVGLALAVGVTVLAVRIGGEEAVWPQPAARRTRPGRHTVATTLRQLEGARRDRGDRDALAARLARLERDGPHPVAATVRAAVPGLSRDPAGRSTSRSTSRSTRRSTRRGASSRGTP